MMELVSLIDELENDIMQFDDQIVALKADKKEKVKKLKKLQKLQDELTGLYECGM